MTELKLLAFIAFCQLVNLMAQLAVFARMTVESTHRDPVPRAAPLEKYEPPLSMTACECTHALAYHHGDRETHQQHCNGENYSEREDGSVEMTRCECTWFKRQR